MSELPRLSKTQKNPKDICFVRLLFPREETCLVVAWRIETRQLNMISGNKSHLSTAVCLNSCVLSILYAWFGHLKLSLLRILKLKSYTMWCFSLLGS